MITFTRKWVLHYSIFSPYLKSSMEKCHCFQLYLCFSSSLAQIEQDQEPKTLSEDTLSYGAKYLIEKFGFPQEKALVSSKNLHFRSYEQPDSVVSFLKEHGFSDAQVKRVIRKTPPVLMSNFESNLLPKIKFFRGLGMSRDETAKILTSCRSLLLRGLDSQIIPSFNFIKDMLKSDKDTIDTIWKYPNMLEINLLQTLPPNFESLREAGVPEVKILHFFRKYPRCFIIPPEEFSKSLKHICDMGISPLLTSSILAIYVMKMLTRSNWEKKIEVFRRWGFSEDQVLAAFKSFPWLMMTSENKIERMMDQLITKMGCGRSALLSSPHVIALSFEKTILPRCAVYKILKSKGLIKKNVSLIVLLKCAKKTFLERFVLCYVKETPELLKVYPFGMNSSK